MLKCNVVIETNGLTTFGLKTVAIAINNDNHFNKKSIAIIFLSKGEFYPRNKISLNKIDMLIIFLPELIISSQSN